jgi:hypothetical protein
MTYFEHDRKDHEPDRERWWLILRTVTPDKILVVRLNASAFSRRESPKPTPCFEFNG